MRKNILSFTGLFLFASVAFAGPPVTSVSVECNWGKLTMESIGAGFDQGPHASDPEQDGYGPGTDHTPRVGLANVVDVGNLEATCLFIESLL